MIRRRLIQTIQHRLDVMPAVVLLGPRQVGKTTLARAIASELGDQALYLDLERDADRRRLDDADAYLRRQAGRLVILDEVHRVPGLFPLLRGIIDDRRLAGERARQFLLLGSASIELQRQAGESLAGRASYLELAPVGLDEWAAHDSAVHGSAERASADRLWLRGGFPESLLASTDADSVNWREDFVRTFLERDIPSFAPGLPAPTIGRLWRMLAHAQGTPLNKARLAGSLELSAPTVSRYLDFLEQMLMVRQLQPWSGNVGKRLVRTPKTYLRDSGLLHALLNLTNVDEVLSHPIAGASWEGFVVEQLVTAAGTQWQPMYFRTATGVEVDLVFEQGGTVDTIVEIKRTTAPAASAGLHSAIATLKPKAAYVVHGGDETWPMPGGITATSVTSMMEHLRRG
ncbi:ATP-binding protein [Gemmatimonas sp.]|uniref:ATP-binding protein n=1 Tax=Gemmatimonas sp. TaxID=1962908 RepID=UPI00286B638E|nr:ATP-binding protein [Gemmatimonas sp.]